MGKKEIIDGLIANKRGKFKEADRATLNQFADDALTAMATGLADPADGLKDVTPAQYLEAAPEHIRNQLRTASAEELKKATDKGAEGTQPTPASPAPTANAQSLATLTPEQWLAQCPPAYREQFSEMAQNHANVKAQLIQVITANALNTFTPQDLGAMSVPQLRSIAALAAAPNSQAQAAPPAPSFFGAAGAFPFTANAQQGQLAGLKEEPLALPVMNFDAKEHFAGRT